MRETSSTEGLIHRLCKTCCGCARQLAQPLRSLPSDGPGTRRRVCALHESNRLRGCVPSVHARRAQRACERMDLLLNLTGEPPHEGQHGDPDSRWLSPLGLCLARHVGAGLVNAAPAGRSFAGAHLAAAHACTCGPGSGPCTSRLWPWGPAALHSEQPPPRPQRAACAPCPAPGQVPQPG